MSDDILWKTMGWNSNQIPLSEIKHVKKGGPYFISNTRLLTNNCYNTDLTLEQHILIRFPIGNERSVILIIFADLTARATGDFNIVYSLVTQHQLGLAYIDINQPFFAIINLYALNKRPVVIFVTTYTGGITLKNMKCEYWYNIHDDVIKWKFFPRYWPFVRGIQHSQVNSPHKGKWRGASIFSLICAWING